MIQLPTMHNVGRRPGRTSLFLLLTVVISWLQFELRAQSPTINTVAGNGSFGFSGDGGQALNASLNGPSGIAIDASGNLYVSDSLNHRIRRVRSDGVIATVAGNGQTTFSGDGKPAIGAGLVSPQGLAVDSAGNLYIADSADNRVRKVSPDGIISTVAGTGFEGFSGDGGLAINATVWGPTDVAVDSAGNLYIVDSLNNRVRKVTSFGVISTVAGTGLAGFSGDPGLATASQLSGPTHVAVDLAGNIFVADSGNSRVREISSNGIIRTVAGNGFASYFGDGRLATDAQLSPMSLTVDAANNLYVVDPSGLRVRRIATNGIISTVAGTGSSGTAGDGGPATSATFNRPAGVAIDTAGNLYLADSAANRVRLITGLAVGSAETSTTLLLASPNPSISGQSVLLTAQVAPPTATGTVTFSDGDVSLGTASVNAGSATLTVALVPTGSHLLTAAYSGDANNPRSTSVTVYQLVNTTGAITTVAGTGKSGSAGDNNLASAAQLAGPGGLAMDSAGNLYIADTNNARVRKVTPGGAISTVAGNGQAFFTGDNGTATNASLWLPSAVAVDAAGSLYIADTFNQRIRRVTNGIINTVAGNGSYGYLSDGVAATSTSLNSPSGLFVDSGGNLYIADTNSFRIRKVTPAGIISTVAGNGIKGTSGDGGPAVKASLNNPQGVAVDSAGNLYIADFSQVRKVTPSGTISTIAGSGSYKGDGGPATSASLSNACAVAVDSGGSVFIADCNSNQVRKVLANGLISTIAGTGVAGFSGDGGPATAAAISRPDGLVVDSSGNLFIADSGNNRVRRGFGLAVDAPTATTTSLTISPNPAASGETVTLSASVSPSSATGSVTFTDGSSLLGTSPLVAGNATLTTSTLAPGTHKIAASYSGDASYNASTSGAGTEVVNAALSSTTTTLTSSPNPSSSGQAVSLRAVVTPSSATGTITFRDGSTPVGSAPVANGAAAITIATLAVGSHTLSAAYGGDATDSSSVSASLTQTVNPPPATAPAISGVVNGATFDKSTNVSTGSWVTIFGTNLAPSTSSRKWNEATEIIAGKFPTSLDGTSVTVDGKPAAVEFVSPGQVNIQPPDDPFIGPVPVVVTANGVVSNTFTVNLVAFAPGFFPAAAPYIVAQHADNSYVGPASPARPGEVIILWGTGFGPAVPAVPSGQVFSGSAPLANLTTVTIGGQPAPVDFAGIVGAGLVQINVRVPSTIDNGDVAVLATVNGVASQATGNMISIHN